MPFRILVNLHGHLYPIAEDLEEIEQTYTTGFFPKLPEYSGQNITIVELKRDGNRIIQAILRADFMGPSNRIVNFYQRKRNGSHESYKNPEGSVPIPGGKTTIVVKQVPKPAERNSRYI
ncbi:MAG: hypothetical protein WCJ19_05300 [bacterium]